jgi:pyruvate/2-oxoglutarate dehydrogenase complex dihydrolipoamide acyltransferase (E2) component
MRQRRTSALRKLSIYGFDSVRGSHNFQALLEFDITDVRSALRRKRQEGRSGSLFAFLLKAIGKCLEEYPEFNSMIDLRRTTVFEEVDISIPIEVESEGELFPKQHVIRNINAKSTKEIDDEIESAKKNKDDQEGHVFPKFYLSIIDRLPGKLVGFIFRYLTKNHQRVQALSGTVFVTSVSMVSNVPGFIIPYSGGPKAVSFAIGSSVKKPVVRNDEIKIREIINITAIFNHDIVDGAPAARLINQMRKLIERDYASLI